MLRFVLGAGFKCIYEIRYLLVLL